MFGTHLLSGKRVLTVRGIRECSLSSSRKTSRKRYFSTRFVLFNDKQTLIEFSDQGDEYHDCAGYAKIISTTQDKVKWSRIFKDVKNYPIADMDVSY